MKKDDEDVEIKRLLEQQCPKSADNPWFTRKVINRLPEQHRSYAWIEYLAYFIGGVICGVYWKEFITGFNFSVITVGTLLEYVALTCVTFGVVLTFVYRAFLRD